MTAKDELSTVMRETLAKAAEKGGRLKREPGGYWTYDGVGRARGAFGPDWWAGTPTIEALVARGRMAYVEWKDGRAGRFPVAAQVVPVVDG